MVEKDRVILLLTAASYRGKAFAAAAEKLGIEVVYGVDIADELAEAWGVRLPLRFTDPDESVERLVEFCQERPAEAILSVDDSGSLIAARASARLGLAHNSPDSARAARDKHVMRQALRDAGAPTPAFQLFSTADDPQAIAESVPYPCVVKPVLLSGSRGVIRADDPQQFVAAFDRLKRILQEVDGSDDVLVESFIPGVEVALEGLLTDGELQVLALFDKPDPLDGPFFEETIYVTPSRLPKTDQAEIRVRTVEAARALGLRHGPLHAELRLHEGRAVVVEVAGRSIGGLCSSVLSFGAGMSLEELILRHATGMELSGAPREEAAAGVMMIPLPGAGLLRSCSGVDQAKAVPGIADVQITVRPGQILVPLPEGASYLGFIFARAETPAQVEASLREAHGRLEFVLTPELPILGTN